MNFRTLTMKKTSFYSLICLFFFIEISKSHILISLYIVMDPLVHLINLDFNFTRVPIVTMHLIRFALRGYPWEIIRLLIFLIPLLIYYSNQIFIIFHRISIVYI